MGKTLPQIKKPDDLQLIANHPVFLHAGRSPSMMETTKNSLAVNLNEILDKLVEQYCI